MSAPLLMICATFLFAAMGVCVKYASDLYGAGEIVMYRGLIGVIGIALVARARGISLKTRVPAMHAWRSVVGVTSLTMWFYAIGHMPLATAVTLNYMSSVWMALFLIGGAVVLGAQRVDPRLVATVLVGFAGVALVLQPSIDKDQMVPGVIGLGSGMLSALAYLQVATLGRAGEPELRVVFYFSIGGFVAGVAMSLLQGWHARHTLPGFALLAATGVFATAAQVLMTRAYAIGKPLSNASLQYLGIAFSFVFGIWLFHDPLTWMAVGGMVLIVGAGLAAARLRATTLSSTAPDTIQPHPDT
ncbi:DMT family transporter [Scleromatobacter humisilvae]|uniref:DMT family transporter n=1 Tax=Scleromatobacter humisilvae TaxID=2897159 RepID=A0A9X2C395_9BURK|nr:DMT family transporter [Scleromatobacter humisilvae]MCK9687784.1 DMT family transporter [Scleromatobacter humisilvae]